MNVFIIEIWRKDTGILSDSLSSVDVVAGAHADSDEGRVALGDGLSDPFAERVLETIDAYHGESLLQHLLILNMLEAVVQGFKLIELAQGHVLVGDHNCPEGLGSEVQLDDLVLNLSFFLFRQF